jgi:hypothetical protein
MKQHFLFLAILACLAACTSLRRAYDPAAAQARMERDVRILAADSMGGRPAGTDYERMAADYIAAEFQRMGLKTQRLPFGVAPAGGDSMACVNLMALLDRHADSTVVIGAHYDHLGMGGPQSLEIRKKGIHPGADDNASGVAVMLELARSLTAAKTLRYNYLFVATSAHEIGLWGIHSLLKEPSFRQHRIRRYLNLDMVGRLNAQRQALRLSYCKDAPPPRDLEALGMEYGLYIRPDDEHSTVNDYSAVCEAGLPALSLTTGVHDDYHRTSDRPGLLNYPGMVLVLNYCRRLVE